METETSYGGVVDTWVTVTRGASRREFLSVHRVSTVVGVSTWSETTALHVMVRASPVDTPCEGGGSLTMLTIGGGTVGEEIIIQCG